MEKFWQRFDRQMPFDKAMALEDLFYELTNVKRQEPFISYTGDLGQGAGTCFAAALWLVDRAGVFLRAIKAAQQSGKIPASNGIIDLSQTIFKALSDEIGLPHDEKLKLISRLLVDIGISLQTDSQDWETNSIQQFKTYAEKASLHFTGSGYELFLLPWAFQIEFRENEMPLKERIASLRRAIPKKVRAIDVEISKHELNSWAYLLLLIGRWKAATPMAIIATEIARDPPIIDTLGWAYYFEGDIERSVGLLSEALEKHDSKAYPESWAEVAYHKLYVLLHSGQRSVGREVLNDMLSLAPNAYWTKRAKNLESLFNLQKGRPATSSQRAIQGFEYDIALSFAGEDRPRAEQLAVELQKRGVNIFYDEFEKADLWGKNLYTYLTDVYRNKARYCIILISKNYVAKRWTNLEREAAQARAFCEDREYILPIRIDDTEVPGLLLTVSYLDWKKEGIDGILKCILEKLEKERFDLRKS